MFSRSEPLLVPKLMLTVSSFIIEGKEWNSHTFKRNIFSLPNTAHIIFLHIFMFYTLSTSYYIISVLSGNLQVLCYLCFHPQFPGQCCYHPVSIRHLEERWMQIGNTLSCHHTPPYLRQRRKALLSVDTFLLCHL